MDFDIKKLFYFLFWSTKWHNGLSKSFKLSFFHLILIFVSHCKYVLSPIIMYFMISSPQKQTISVKINYSSVYDRTKSYVFRLIYDDNDEKAKSKREKIRSEVPTNFSHVK